MSLEQTNFQNLIDRLSTGDCTARDELLVHAEDRLRRLTRTLLQGYPGVKRWEDTDDVLQNASLRLWRALEDVTPSSVRHFFNLAALQIGRELIDLARRYYGPLGHGKYHETPAATSPASDTPRPRYESLETTHEPSHLAQWTEVHEQIALLPETDREIVWFIYYHGLKQSEVAELLHVSVRTVKRRWQEARLQLHQALNGKLPGRAMDWND